MCSTEASSVSSQLYFEHNVLPPLARTLTYSCPVLQYPGPFFTTMLLVPSVESPHVGGHGHHIGPIRADHAALRCDPNVGSYLRPSPGLTGPCWPLTPSSKASLPARPLSLHFETLPNHVRAPIAPRPRRVPSPVRMGLATNPRVRRRSTETPQPPVIHTSTPAPSASLVWTESPLEMSRVVDLGGPGPIKARPSRRSNTAKELFQHIKKSAKKKMDRLRRSLSSERLSGQRSRSSILRSPDGSESSGSAAQHRRISSPCMVLPSCESSPEAEERDTVVPLEDTFPRGRLVGMHPDGSHTIRLVRHPKHAFGFFVSLDHNGMASRGMFISRMAHPQLEERLHGLLDVGDELLTVEDISCATMSLEQLQLIVGSRLVLELRVQSRPFL